MAAVTVHSDETQIGKLEENFKNGLITHVWTVCVCGRGRGHKVRSSTLKPVTSGSDYSLGGSRGRNGGASEADDREACLAELRLLRKDTTGLWTVPQGGTHRNKPLKFTLCPSECLPVLLIG